MAAVRIGIWFPPRISLDSGTDTVELYIVRSTPVPFIRPSSRLYRRETPVRRGKFMSLAAQQNAVPPTVIDQPGTRPRSAPLSRRGRFGLVVGAQVGPGEGPLVLGVTRQAGWRPRWTPAIRRGAFLPLSLPQIGPGEALPAPTASRARLWIFLSVRRGQFQALPALPFVSPIVGHAAGQRPRTLGLARRGRFVPAVPPQIGPGEAVPAPVVARARLRVFVPFRRGVFQAIPAPVVWPPLMVRIAGRCPRTVGLPRRGRIAPVVPVQIGPGEAYPAPSLSRAPIRRGFVARRGQFFTLSLAAPFVAPSVAHVCGYRPKWTPAIRRGRYLIVPPVQVGPGEGPLAPAAHRSAARPGLVVRRGVFQPAFVASANVPLSLRRSRVSALAPHRGQFQQAPFSVQAGSGPLVGSWASPARRYIGWPTRRGLVRPRPWFEPPRPQALVPPFVHHSGSRPKWGPLPRRGQFSSALLVGLAPAPPVPPVGNVVRNRTRVALARRGQFFAIPQVAPTISTIFVRRVRVAASIRRTTFLSIAPTPRIAPWVPAPIQARRAPAVTVHRGTFQSTLAVSPIVVRLPRRTRIAPWVRRGQFQAVPAVAQVPLRIVRPTTPRISAARRGRISTPLSVLAAPPRWYRCTRPVSGARRGRFSVPPPPKPAGPGPLCPSMLRATRRYAGLPVRRGRWIQGVVPPQVFFPAPVATGVGTTAPLAVATTASTAVLAVATSGATVGLLDGAFPGATTFTGTTTFPGVGFATPIAH